MTCHRSIASLAFALIALALTGCADEGSEPATGGPALTLNSAKQTDAELDVVADRCVDVFTCETGRLEVRRVGDTCIGGDMRLGRFAKYRQDTFMAAHPGEWRADALTVEVGFSDDALLMTCR